MEFHYRRRYSLPATDPRYLDATMDDIVLDYWAHAFLDNPKLREEVVNPDFEGDLAAFEKMFSDSDDAAVGRAPPGGDTWETVADDKWS